MALLDLFLCNSAHWPATMGKKCGLVCSQLANPDACLLFALHSNIVRSLLGIEKLCCTGRTLALALGAVGLRHESCPCLPLLANPFVGALAFQSILWWPEHACLQEAWSALPSLGGLAVVLLQLHLWVLVAELPHLLHLLVPSALFLGAPGGKAPARCQMWCLHLCLVVVLPFAFWLPDALQMAHNLLLLCRGFVGCLALLLFVPW